MDTQEWILPKFLTRKEMRNGFKDSYLLMRILHEIIGQQVGWDKQIPYTGSSVEDVFDKIKMSPEFDFILTEDVREGVRYLHSCVMIQCKYTDGEDSRYYVDFIN